MRGKPTIVKTIRIDPDEATQIMKTLAGWRYRYDWTAIVVGALRDAMDSALRERAEVPKLYQRIAEATDLELLPTEPFDLPAEEPEPPLHTKSLAGGQSVVVPTGLPTPEPEPVQAPEPEPVQTPEPEPVQTPEPEPVQIPEPEPTPAKAKAKAKPKTNGKATPAKATPAKATPAKATPAKATPAAKAMKRLRKEQKGGKR